MTEDQVIAKKAEGALFGIKRSIRYHHCRAAFFNHIHRSAMFVNFFVVTLAGVLALSGYGSYALLLSMLVALFTALDTTLECARHHGLHMLLAYRFQALEKRFKIFEQLPQDKLEEVIKDRLSIQQQEPVAKRLLDVMCHHEEVRSTKCTEKLDISWWRWLLSHILSQTEYAQDMHKKHIDKSGV